MKVSIKYDIINIRKKSKILQKEDNVMKATWEEHAKNIFKEDASIVLNFFEGELQAGRVFNSENYFLNEIERRLVSYCSILQEKEGDFWFNRRVSLQAYQLAFSRVRHNIRTIVYVIGLLQKEKEARGITGGCKSFSNAVRKERKLKQQQEIEEKESWEATISFEELFEDELFDEFPDENDSICL